MIYLVNTDIYSNIIYKTGMFNGKRDIAIPVCRGFCCMCPASHTDIQRIGSHWINTKHILFETRIIGTNIPSVNLSLHLFI